MQTLPETKIHISIPANIAEGHFRLPDETRIKIESEVARTFLELSVIEQYKHAMIYLSDVSVALGHYPDVQKTMKWLGTHKVPLGGTAEDFRRGFDALKDLVVLRKIENTTP